MSGKLSVFPAEKMVGLLQKIDDNVRQAVHTLRKEGAEVRKKVVDLLTAYMELLTNVVEECALFENTTQILLRRLSATKDTLTKVLIGKVSVILTDLDEYKAYFDRKGLKYAYQLVKDDFRVEQLELPEGGESEIIKDRIAALRRDYKGVEDVIKEVKKEGETRHPSCKDIGKKLKTFLEHISATSNAISTLLEDRPNEDNKLIVSQLTAGLIAGGCLLSCFIGAVFWFNAGAAAPFIVKAATPLLGVGAAAAGVGWYTARQKEEMEKAYKALDNVQNKYLHDMKENAAKQKTDWDYIVIQVSKMVHYITESGVEKKAHALDPSHHTLVKEVLDGIQDMLKDATELHKNVARFKKDARQVELNLRDLSVMKTESGEVPATPKRAAQRVLLPLWDLVDFFQSLLKSQGVCFGPDSKVSS